MGTAERRPSQKGTAPFVRGKNELTTKEEYPWSCFARQALSAKRMFRIIHSMCVISDQAVRVCPPEKNQSKRKFCTKHKTALKLSVFDDFKAVFACF